MLSTKTSVSMVIRVGTYRDSIPTLIDVPMSKLFANPSNIYGRLLHLRSLVLWNNVVPE